MAALLRVELCGLLVKENELTGLAALPFAREFRTLEGGWHALDLERLAHDVDVAADRAQRTFAEVARALGLVSQLEVVRGSMAQAIASVSRAGDVVVISEPSSPAERITVQFQSMVDAALGSSAAVMVMPPRVVRQHGPVVAIAATPDDESIEVGAAIATLASAELIVVEAFAPGGEVAAGKIVGGAARRLPFAAARERNLTTLSAALRPLQERLLVLTRGALDDPLVAQIASVRGIPVLVIEPEKLLSEASS